MIESVEATPVVRLQTLGDLALYASGRRLGEARRKPLALLAYLAAEAPGSVNREKAAGLLWPESAPERGRHTLTQTIYALRREADVALVSGSSQLALSRTAVTSDLEEFTQAVGSGNHRRAVELYTGPFLDGFVSASAAEFDQWIDRTRLRLANLHRNAFIACAE